MDIQTPNSAPARSVNKTVVIGVIIGLVVVIGGLVLWSNNTGGPNPEEVNNPTSPNPLTTEQVEKRQQEVLTVTQSAMATGDNSACAALLTDAEKVACRARVIISTAQNTFNVSLCKGISDSYWNTNCQDSVYMFQAVAKGNPSYCDKMPSKERISVCKSQVK